MKEKYIEEYLAVALQLDCHAINKCQTKEESHDLMMKRIQDISNFVQTTVNFHLFFYGSPVKLVVLPEYTVCGFPLQETPQEWQEKGCFEIDGPEYEAFSKIAQENDIYLAGNTYEIDPNFPEIYFQTCFIIDPSGDVIVRYRRLTSVIWATPHDVWDKYLDLYGYEKVFPVAKTEIGNLACIASEEIMYPEIARCHVMRGAEILLHPSSEPGSPRSTEKEICRRARAAENLAYVITANTSTILNISVPAYTCSGMSKIVDYRGKILSEASAGGESHTANAFINLRSLRKYRRNAGMTNYVSRQGFDAYAQSYAEADFLKANSLLKDGKVQQPSREFFLRRQEKVIEKLIAKGIL